MSQPIHEETSAPGRREAVDTGMALALVCLVAGFATSGRGWFVAAAAALAVAMTAPMFYRPLARLWFGLSRLMGAVMSRVILCVVFFGLVTPLALVRRVLGHDPMALRKWRGEGSVFVVRDHTYEAREIERPF